VRKGDVIYLPKGIPHAPRVTGNDEAAVVVVCVPGGFDRLLATTIVITLSEQSRYKLARFSVRGALITGDTRHPSRRVKPTS